MLTPKHIPTLLVCSVLAFALCAEALQRTNATLDDKAELAVSTDHDTATKAQEELRIAGPQGLQALEIRFADEIAAHRNGAPIDEHWKRISVALNRVSGQYDDYASGLYWFTDLEKAKVEARRTNRPILSLRLLGRLDEDLSCANSRFFRTTLYPSTGINALLKDRYVLHWESVRPVPRVTIVFDDSHTIERTIAGNSIHYILNAEGKIVDALPGLYSAKVFASELRLSADAVSKAYMTNSQYYSAHQHATQNRLTRAWEADLATIHQPYPGKNAFNNNDLSQWTDDKKWMAISKLHEDDATADTNVREVMVRKFPDATTASRVALSKNLSQSVMLRAFVNMNDSIAVDTVKNNYMRRIEILQQLIRPEAQTWSLKQMNDWVYAKVFLTPRQDPWLGLSPPDVYSAIEGNGEKGPRHDQ